MKIRHTKDYAQARAAEYPPIEEQLEAIWNALRHPPVAPPALDMIRRIDAVKTKYPKPSKYPDLPVA